MSQTFTVAPRSAVHHLTDGTLLLRTWGRDGRPVAETQLTEAGALSLARALLNAIDLGLTVRRSETVLRTEGGSWV